TRDTAGLYDRDGQWCQRQNPLLQRLIMYTPTPIRSQPGIKRDGTQFEGDFYTDGQWMRFQRGLPRKMGGYRNTTPRLRNKVYGISSFSADLLTYIACGESDLLEQ